MILGGVSKSGSPTVSPMILRPACCNSRTRIVAIELGEGLMRFILGAMKDMLKSRFSGACGAPAELKKGLC
jgi:hypothetical protein